MCKLYVKANIRTQRNFTEMYTVEPPIRDPPMTSLQRILHFDGVLFDFWDRDDLSTRDKMLLAPLCPLFRCSTVTVSQVKVPFPILFDFHEILSSLCHFAIDNLSNWMTILWTFQLMSTSYYNTNIRFTNLSPKNFRVHKFVNPDWWSWQLNFAKFCICWNVYTLFSYNV